MHFNAAELVIILLIVVVLFGGGRIGKLGGEMGTALREFRRGLSGEDDKTKNSDTVAPQQTIANLPDPTSSVVPMATVEDKDHEKVI